MTTRLAVFSLGDIRTGGGHRVIIDLCNRLTKQGFDITIFSHEQKHNIRITKEQAEKIILPKIVYYKAIESKSINERIPLTPSSLKVFNSLKDFDVVYNIDPSIVTNYLLIKYCKTFNIRLIFGIHDPGVLGGQPMISTLPRQAVWPIYSKMQISLIRQMDNIHIINKERIGALKKIGYKHKVYYIPNYLFNEVDPDSIKVNQKEFIVMFIARLAVRDKGVDTLERIIDNVLAKEKSIKFHIIGSGHDGETIIERLKKKYPKNVKWYNYFVSNKKLEQEQRNASLYLMPSRWESLPLVLLEAQSFGLPAVASNVPGPNGIIANKFQGALLDMNDADGFADAVLDYYGKWMKDKKGMLKTKKEIARYMDRNYSARIIVPKLKKMLSKSG